MNDKQTENTPKITLNQTTSWKRRTVTERGNLKTKSFDKLSTLYKLEE